MKMMCTGWKHSKGDFDGVAYDKLTLFALAKMEQKETQRGSAGIDMQCDVAIKQQLEAIHFNGVVDCEVATEQWAKGKGQFVEVVVSVVPLPEQTGTASKNPLFNQKTASAPVN